MLKIEELNEKELAFFNELMVHQYSLWILRETGEIEERKFDTLTGRKLSKDKRRRKLYTLSQIEAVRTGLVSLDKMQDLESFAKGYEMSDKLFLLFRNSGIARTHEYFWEEVDFLLTATQKEFSARALGKRDLATKINYLKLRNFLISDLQKLVPISRRIILGTTCKFFLDQKHVWTESFFGSGEVSFSIELSDACLEKIREIGGEIDLCA